MDEHEVVCVGHQFSNGVRFMTLTTTHLLLNMARAKNCGWQAQGHFDAAFNWCGKEIALIGFGMNSMGAHFNPVSVSIANSESKEGIANAYKATCSGFYTVFNSANLCEGVKCETCGFCTQVLEQISEPDPASPKGSLWNKHLLSIDAGNTHYQLDNPSSDNSKAFFAGYVGNNKSAGIESHWKYMRRDTVGVAGSGKRTGLGTFIPMLMKYLSDLSKRHADKLLCPITGAHRFPSLPVISAKMWAKVAAFDVKRLLLSRINPRTNQRHGRRNPTFSRKCTRPIQP